jgi:hypothetical protein
MGRELPFDLYWECAEVRVTPGAAPRPELESLQTDLTDLYVELLEATNRIERGDDSRQAIELLGERFHGRWASHAPSTLRALTDAITLG